MRTDGDVVVAGRSADLAEGEMKRVELSGRPILLARVEGQVYALDDTCSHAQVSLAGGWLDGHTVECPMHGAMFDLRDGSAQCLPATSGVGSYPVIEEDGDLLLVIDERPAASQGA
jgi:3-phenylpropionate/trans-cinnamate dioxygenase ferredoxin subunit